jgi:CubicO group peptidase (beta-lactamase class C family)
MTDTWRVMTPAERHDAGAPVHGHCEPGFARVREAFAGTLASGFEVGAALAVHVDGRPVVDLWGGHADAARTRPWERDTIVNLYSVGKAARAGEEQVYGDDIVLQRPTRFGLGFQLTMKERPLGPNARTFGHFGAGGSLGFADPDARLAFGYAMNQGRAGWQHRHVRHLIDLVYAAL